MDTSATSHMSKSQGTLMHYFPLKHHFSNAIIVGNDHMIPVHGYRHVSLLSPNQSLTLKNVLHTPILIKNLIFCSQI